MFSPKRPMFLKPAGIAWFFTGVATLLVLATPAMAQTFAYGNYCTFTQGGWGATPHGNNPAMILANNFSTVYPSGVVIGDTALYTMTFTSALAIQNYLPAGGKAGALTGSLTDPTSSPSGVFGGQVLTLELNVDFSTAGIIQGAVGSLFVFNTNTSFDGKSVWDVLAAANYALGGGNLADIGHADYSIRGNVTGTYNLNDLVSFLNQGFDNCYPSGWVQDHLTPNSSGGDNPPPPVL